MESEYRRKTNGVREQEKAQSVSESVFSCKAV
jgi:hypothetical protein